MKYSWLISQRLWIHRPTKHVFSDKSLESGGVAPPPALYTPAIVVLKNDADKKQVNTYPVATTANDFFARS
jgi:hypothetical protein